MGISNPHSDTWSGTPGHPTAPSSTASYDRSVSIASSGIIAPVSAYRWHDQSKSSYTRERSYADAAASRTERATAITSWPIPSPGTTAIRWAARHQRRIGISSGRNSRIRIAPMMSKLIPDLIIFVIGTAPEP